MQRLIDKFTIFITLLTNKEINKGNLYAVKVQRSLAPLSRFRGSHITTAHEQQCCRFQSFCENCAIANEIDKRNWQSVNHIPGIHDNGPRDHGLWRLTLTAYTLKMMVCQKLSFRPNCALPQRSLLFDIRTWIIALYIYWRLFDLIKIWIDY